MIIVKGIIPVTDNGREEALLLVETLAMAAQKEPGCVSYEVYQKARQPDVIMVWQQWTNIDAVEKHFCSAHLDDFLDAIPDYIAGDVETARFDVQPDPNAPVESDLQEHNSLVIADNVTLH